MIKRLGIGIFVRGAIIGIAGANYAVYEFQHGTMVITASIGCYLAAGGLILTAAAPLHHAAKQPIGFLLILMGVLVYVASRIMGGMDLEPSGLAYVKWTGLIMLFLGIGGQVNTGGM